MEEYTFSKVAGFSMGVFHVFKIEQMDPNRAKHHYYLVLAWKVKVDEVKEK